MHDVKRGTAKNQDCGENLSEISFEGTVDWFLRIAKMKIEVRLPRK